MKILISESCRYVHARKVNKTNISLSDRERFNEMEWTRPAEEAEEKAAKLKKLEESHRIIDALREKIKAATERLHLLTGVALEAQRKLIVGLKKRANEIHAQFAFNRVPLYKVEARKATTAAASTTSTKIRVKINRKHN